MKAETQNTECRGGLDSSLVLMSEFEELSEYAAPNPIEVRLFTNVIVMLAILCR